VSEYGSVLSSNNAHSTPAQVGATFGLVVFLIYTMIHVWILYKALKIISSRDTSDFYLKGICLVWILVFAQSLLSIEIIGLGIMNWVLGAVILSAKSKVGNSESGEAKSIGKKQKTKQLPAWTGSITIASLLIGATPAVTVTREDKAFKNILLIQISDEKSKDIVRQEFTKLSNLTLFYPNNVDRIAGNLFQADMSLELQTVVENLYQVESKDAYAADLIATYYKSINEFPKEIEIREKLRSLDPWNLKLELVLAQAYSAVGNESKVEESINRIKSLAPESPEYQEALLLLKPTTDTP
jgi:tetratricopeptide (TPR) repeat protein